MRQFSTGESGNQTRTLLHLPGGMNLYTRLGQPVSLIPPDTSPEPGLHAIMEIPSLGAGYAADPEAQLSVRSKTIKET